MTFADVRLIADPWKCSVPLFLVLWVQRGVISLARTYVNDVAVAGECMKLKLNVASGKFEIYGFNKYIIGIGNNR